MKNALAVDLEFWYSIEEFREIVKKPEEDQILESTEPILELFSAYNLKATFAVQGAVAEKYPHLIKEIARRGHEIASHAYSHKPVCFMSPREFEQEINKSVELLGSLTGYNPIGFRAPTSSINNSTLWALDILEKYGFQYEATLCPAWTPQYGVPGAPLIPYHPSSQDIRKRDDNRKLVIFPMTVLDIGVKFPVAGGFWLRAAPLWFSRWALNHVNRSRPGMVYIHPWETYGKTPRVPGLSWASNLVVYFGINSSLKKLKALLEKFEFAPIRDVLGLQLS